MPSLMDTTILGPACGPAPLLQQWEAEVVVYHRLSADTHLLPLATADLLRAVLDEPQTYAELRRHFVSFNTVELTSEELEEYLQEMLQQLLSLDLIQQLEAHPA